MKAVQPMQNIVKPGTDNEKKNANEEEKIKEIGQNPINKNESSISKSEELIKEKKRSKKTFSHDKFIQQKLCFKKN